VQVWHSDRALPLRIAYWELAIYAHIDRSVLLSFSCSSFACTFIVCRGDARVLRVLCQVRVVSNVLYHRYMGPGPTHV
jgi:hypothetical protein